VVSSRARSITQDGAPEAGMSCNRCRLSGETVAVCVYGEPGVWRLVHCSAVPPACRTNIC
jgi:hypothetical protein